jgi:hypothetical protein
MGKRRRRRTIDSTSRQQNGGKGCTTPFPLVTLHRAQLDVIPHIVTMSEVGAVRWRDGQLLSVVEVSEGRIDAMHDRQGG